MFFEHIFWKTHITIMLFISLGKEKYNLLNDVQYVILS